LVQRRTATEPMCDRMTRTEPIEIAWANDGEIQMNTPNLLSIKLLLATLAVVTSLADANRCAAQVARYQPSRPTVSPYLELSRFNNGTVPNYYSFVRPLQQQRRFNRQEQTLRRQQAGTLGRLESDFRRVGRTPTSATGTGSWFLTPGSRSSFLDTSRYYPQTVIGRRGR